VEQDVRDPGTMRADAIGGRAPALDLTPFSPARLTPT